MEMDWAWWLWLTACVGVVAGYNMDLRTAVVHGARPGRRGRSQVQPGSMFGYSVAQHTDRTQTWLLVGAPKTNTTQQGITEGGAIYRCSIHARECHLVNFDNNGNNIKYISPGQYKPKEEKSHQWFGATVASSGAEGTVVGCAPRYVYFSERLNKREPVGACYVMPPSSQRAIFYSPCMTGGSSYHRQGFCQAGMSAALTDDGSKMVIGAVGSYYWQGQVFSQDLLRDELEPNETRQGPVSDDYNYMGYAVAVGDFSGYGKQDYAVGLPRANNLVGMMAIYAPNMSQLLNVSGEQFGEYFGSAVAVGDFNGDSYDDVAMGAPLYTDNNAEYETGRVLVYYQNSGRTLDDAYTVLRGAKTTASRFGFAIASLGDINRNGCHDLVVGAPYGGLEGHGTIYIFNGHAKGMRIEPSQIIEAATISPALRTFGFSLSGGLDLDKNGYPDVLIGAYKSDMAVFLRSRPILKVELKVSIAPVVIDLEDRNCPLGDGTSIVCFTIKTCITYRGHRVPASIALYVTWKLEAERPFTSRAFYMKSPKQTTESATITLNKGRPDCSSSRAYLKPSFRDKLKPITADATYSLVETLVTGNDVTPILDLYTPKTVRANGDIKKDCGSDNKCIPDLVIHTKAATDSYTLGTSDVPLEVMVVISNRGEGAYEAQVTMLLPPGTSYVNVHDIISPLPVKCALGVGPEGEELPDIVICDLGNPLPATAKVRFTLRVMAFNITGEVDTIQFIMNVSSANPENENTLANNEDEAVIVVRARAIIRLTGVSDPERMFLNATSRETEEDVGKELVHLYEDLAKRDPSALNCDITMNVELRNLGPSPVETTSVVVYWPNYLDAGHDLLYLHVNPEVIQGEGSCTVLTHPINPRNISVKLVDDDENTPRLSVNLQEMLKQRQGQRHRRQTERSRLTERRPESEQLIRRVACTPRSKSLCATIQCDTGRVEADDFILIRIKSRVWVRSLIDIPQRALIVTSTAEAQVMSVPYDVMAEEYSVDTFQIDTYLAVLQTGQDYGRLEIWVIALSISGGFILLLLLILLLWWCGFFKREKPDDMTKLNPHHNGKSTAALYDAIPADEL